MAAKYGGQCKRPPEMWIPRFLLAYFLKVNGPSAIFFFEEFCISAIRSTRLGIKFKVVYKLPIWSAIAGEMRDFHQFPRGLQPWRSTRKCSRTTLVFTVHQMHPEILPESVKCQLFADDILIYCSGKSPSRLATSLPDAVTTLKTWLDGRGLCLNVDKTKAMFLPPSTCLIPADITVESSNIPLSTVSSYKYIGLIIDSALTCDAHIDSVVRKVSKKIGIPERAGNPNDQRHKAEVLLSSGPIRPTIRFECVLDNSF